VDSTPPCRGVSSQLSRRSRFWYNGSWLQRNKILTLSRITGSKKHLQRTPTVHCRTVHCPLLLALSLSLSLSLVSPAAAQSSFTSPFVTRAEAVTILLKTRLKGDPPSLQNAKGFPDVPKGSWFERPMLYAERYGIINSDPVTGQLHPERVVLRSEFLKMLAQTFSLQTGLPYLYTDVPENAWFAPYAGIASRYALFPADTDRSRLSPQSLLSHVEVVRVLRIIGKQVDPDRLPALQERDVSALQSGYNLDLYGKISTRTDDVTVLDPSNPGSNRPAPAPQGAPRLTPTLPVVRAAILSLVNRERAKAGLPPVKADPTLEASAQRYAQDMAARGFFAHVDPEGRTLQDRTEASGYFHGSGSGSDPCLCAIRFMVGENLARGQKTVADVMRDWIASPSHRVTILTFRRPDPRVGTGCDQMHPIGYIAANVLPNATAASGPFPVTMRPSTVTGSPVYTAPRPVRNASVVPSLLDTVARLPASTPASARIVGAMQMAPSGICFWNVSRAMRRASAFLHSSIAPGPPMKATRS
jgi:uncharacterized protein YkwD